MTAGAIVAGVLVGVPVGVVAGALAARLQGWVESRRHIWRVHCGGVHYGVSRCPTCRRSLFFVRPATDADFYDPSGHLRSLRAPRD